jgi:hypothetical protein
MKNNVTFVTSYLKIYDSEYDNDKTFEKRLKLFIKIVNLGINICIFTSPEFEPIFNEIAEQHKNVKIIQVLSINDLEFSKLGNQYNDLLVLPDKRSHIKDHVNYMYLMHAKIEFIKKTIDINPFNNLIFCWFDFSLPYIFKNTENSLLKIKKISLTNYINDKFIVMPGCWDYKINNINTINNQIAWRFCGGFFIGDKASLINFYNVSIARFVEFLNLTKKIVWEVNYWAWLEGCGHINPIWYLADHNDSIIDVPTSIHINTLLLEANDIIVYNYPEIKGDDKFFPSSASYIYDYLEHKHILNTRYVNYFYKDNWDCDFFNESRQIKTINIKSELNEKFECLNYEIVNNDDINLNPNHYAFSVGLEDIRLYHDNNSIKFIASNINYIPSGRNRMIIGDYDYKNCLCKNLKIVNMLWESRCEKNWSPIPNCIDNNKLFIYKWSPFSLGYINKDSVFELCMQKQYNNEIINKFRGSTPFIEYDHKYFIGVVHYSVHSIPPIYYHSLVLLNKTTNLPEYFCKPFKFSTYPIEFCIGFTIVENEYLFWISKMDREPMLIKIDKNKIDIDIKID